MRISTLWHRLRERVDQRWFYVFFILVMLLPNCVLFFSPYLSFTASCINILLPLGAYMMILALGRRPGKVMLIALMPLLVLGLGQLVQLSVFAGSPISVDTIMNLFASNSDEAGELLSGIILPIVGSVLILLTTIVAGICSWRMRRSNDLRGRRRTLAVGGGIMLLGLALIPRAGQKMRGYSIFNEVYPINVFHHMTIAAHRLGDVARYPETSKGFTYSAYSERRLSEREIYVFVIGETSRAYSWSLYGYDRETNPRLSQRRNQMSLFYDLTTQSNTTYKSVPIMLSPADAQDVDSLAHYKGILTAMKEAGFHTVYISNQPENRSFVDYFASEANEFYRMKTEHQRKHPQELFTTAPLHDEQMLPYLEQALQSPHQRLFVILHSYGSHFKYKDRYSRAQAYFAGDDADLASPRLREPLRNGYDNAIRSTDAFLDQAIGLLEAQPNALTALFYTSDHGEDIFDDERERILHSSPSLSYYQLHIPGFFWTGEQYRARYPELVQTAQSHERSPITTAVVFHSLLQMAGVQTHYLDPCKSLLSPQLQTGTRYYLNDRYEAVPLEALGLEPQDLIMWERMGMAPLKPSAQ